MSSSNAYPSQGYQNRPQAGNPRQTEAWALTEAARRLREAQQADPFDAGRFLDALRLNWRLWTIFQAELCSPECQVPMDIRRNMLALSNFVDKTTVGLLANPQPEKANVLININRELAAGLFADPAQAQQQPAQPQGAQEPPASGGGGLDFSA